MFEMRDQAIMNGRQIYLSTALRIFGLDSPDATKPISDDWNEVIKQIHHDPGKKITISGKSYYDQEAKAVNCLDLCHIGALYTELIEDLEDDTADYCAGISVRNPTPEIIEIGNKAN